MEMYRYIDDFKPCGQTLDSRLTNEDVSTVTLLVHTDILGSLGIYDIIPC